MLMITEFIWWMFKSCFWTCTTSLPTSLPVTTTHTHILITSTWGQLTHLNTHAWQSVRSSAHNVCSTHLLFECPTWRQAAPTWSHCNTDSTQQFMPRYFTVQFESSRTYTGRRWLCLIKAAFKAEFLVLDICNLLHSPKCLLGLASAHHRSAMFLNPLVPSLVGKITILQQHI